MTGFQVADPGEVSQGPRTKNPQVRTVPLKLAAVLSWYVPKVLLDAIRTVLIDLQRFQGGWRVGFVPEA